MKTEKIQAKLARIMPLYIVKDVPETIRFYRENLGFEVQFQNSDEEPFFAMLGRDGIFVMFKQVSEDVLPLSNTERHEDLPWDAYWSMENPEAFFEEIEASNEVKICRSVETTSYGCRDFIFQDLNGYRFCCGTIVDRANSSGSRGGVS